MTASFDAQQRTHDTVTALYDAYNTHDARAAGALYARGGCHAEIATGAAQMGDAAISAGLAGFLGAFPDAHWEERIRIVDGERAAVRYVLTGTLQARLGPFEPAGQQLELSGVHLLRVGADGIEECEDHWDASTFGRQMRS